MIRSCYKCSKPEGKGPRELRPYGPGGKDVCAECTFGSKESPPDPKVEKEARKQLGRRLMSKGPLLLDHREQVGPRPVQSLSKGKGS